MFSLRWVFAGLLFLSPLHAEEKEIKLKVGGKDFVFTEVTDLVVLSGVTVTDPPADAKEE